MPRKQNANIDEDLRQRVGHDATSNFESDPEFTDNIPTANASSENLGATGGDLRASSTGNRNVRREAIAGTGSAAGESLSGNTSRHPNQQENDEGPSLDEDDETTVNRDTGYDRPDATLEAEEDEEDDESLEDEEDEDIASGPESSTEDDLEDSTQDRTSQPIGSRTPSQDETRLEGESESARGRGSRKTPRQAA